MSAAECRPKFHVSQRLEGKVGGEEPSDHVGDGEGEAVDEDQADDSAQGDKDAIRLGDVGLLFDLDEDPVPRELKAKTNSGQALR